MLYFFVGVGYTFSSSITSVGILTYVERRWTWLSSFLTLGRSNGGPVDQIDPSQSGWCGGWL